MTEPTTPLISEKLMLRIALLAAALTLLLAVGLGLPVVFVIMDRGWTSTATASWVQASGSVAALFTAIGLAVISAAYRFASNTRVAVAVCEYCVEVLRDARRAAESKAEAADLIYERQALSRSSKTLEQLPYIPMSRYVRAEIALATALDIALQICSTASAELAVGSRAQVLGEQLTRAEAILADVRKEFWWFRHATSLLR